ncbi:mitochondrial carrier domain-containing protein [Globomyces pollinis-pini]|nr:mitochondrial carrier domain-containing protein [Globomyces pollinis-pini]
MEVQTTLSKLKGWFSEPGPYWKTIQPFVFGGTAGMVATTCIQPIDMVKVSIQLHGKGGVTNPFIVAKDLIAKDGVFSLYRGLSAGLLRQATYTTARMGIFRTISNKLKAEDGSLTFAKRAVAGLIAGGLGSVVGTPCDLALVRMQADLSLPPNERANYKNVVDALYRIAKADGISGLWAGCVPTVARAMALNVGMLATYDQAKDTLEAKFGKNGVTSFTSSAIAGFFASAASLPFDFVKTRIQKMTPDANGKLPYRGSIDCALKVLRTEGPMAFYKGFWTFYVRIAPHAMITLLVADTLRQKFGAN